MCSMKVGGRLYEDSGICHIREVFMSVLGSPMKLKDKLWLLLLINTKKAAQFLAGGFWLHSQYMSPLRMPSDPFTKYHERLPGMNQTWSTRGF